MDTAYCSCFELPATGFPVIDFIHHLLYLGTPKALNKAASECDADSDGSGKPCISTSTEVHIGPDFKLSRGLVGQVTTLFSSASTV